MGDFLALITAFLTLTSGIYLFQNVGESVPFQQFLTFVIISTNVAYMLAVAYWYLALRLVDMENELLQLDGDESGTMVAWLVMLLQKFVPDWRRDALKEELAEASTAEKLVVHNVNVNRVMRVKRIAQRWRARSQQHSFERQARELEKEHAAEQVRLVRKLEELRVKQKEKLERRRSSRRMSHAALRATAAKQAVGKLSGGGSSTGSTSSEKQQQRKTLLVPVSQKAAEKAAAEQEAKEYASMLVVTVDKKHKIGDLGFSLGAAPDGRCVVTGLKEGGVGVGADKVPKGAVLSFVGAIDVRDERSMATIVRLLRTQPRPMELRLKAPPEGHTPQEASDGEVV